MSIFFKDVMIKKELIILTYFYIPILHVDKNIRLILCCNSGVRKNLQNKTIHVKIHVNFSKLHVVFDI